MTLTPFDHEDIRRLLARYSVALDFGDTAALRDCFAPDGRFTERGLPQDAGGQAEFVGRERIGAFAESFFERARGQLRHWPSLPLVEGDGTRATGVTFLMVLRAGAAPGTGVVLTGVYRDRFTKLDGQWYFAVREFAADPQPEHADADRREEGEPGHAGAVGADPLVARFDAFVAGCDHTTAGSAAERTERP